MPDEQSAQQSAASIEEAHHNDNQRRFIVMEAKLDKLSSDTAELLGMWSDAGVFFKWMRKAGALIVWLRNVAMAAVAIYILWRYGSGEGKP